MHNVDKEIGLSPSLGNALENIVEQLDVLTLVSMQEQIAPAVENNNFINGEKTGTVLINQSVKICRVILNGNIAK